MVGANPSPTPVGDASKHVASKLASSPAPGPVEVAPIDLPLPSIAATIDRTVARLSPVRSNCWKHGKAMTPSRWERTVEPSASTVSRGAAAGAAWASECAPKCGLTPREKARPDAKWCESTCAPTQTAPRSEAESGARLGDPVRGGASKRVKGLEPSTFTLARPNWTRLSRTVDLDDDVTYNARPQQCPVVYDASESGGFHAVAGGRVHRIRRFEASSIADHSLRFRAECAPLRRALRRASAVATPRTRRRR